ncbi:hypothetical protein B2G71_01315 [Novosphingobium sp. PC22D]|nr:hypothetical protein B2G71_01315 [Novosphingobium sp. PC22D]
MKFSQFAAASLGLALVAGCGESPDTATGQGDSLPAAEPVAGSDGRTYDLADYGYIDGQEVTPIGMPGWMPAEISLPGDFVPLEERSLGTRTHLLRGVTQEPGDGLYDSLSADLREAGFEVRDGEGYRADNLVYFSGNGYEDSKIDIRPGDNDTLLEISLSESG